jgi:serine/threonine-protein kinase
MLTGQLPFKGEYDQAVIYSILNVEPEQITDKPEELGSIIYKALEKSPEDRYPKAGDVINDLRKLQTDLEFHISKEKSASEKTKPSIAVLPFQNMSADPEQEYFCDGMSEEILNALEHVENLCVVARTSAFAFKGKQEDIREIGKKLNVNTVLEGSVRKSGNRLRITVQLINVADGYHLWSERYDRELEDVFAIQDEISLAIVENLKIKLLKAEKELILKRYTEDLEAYNLYLQGQYFWQMFTEEGFEKAFECCEQALKKDPNYALAYCGLGRIFFMQAYFVNLPPYKAYPEARNHTEKALSIDNTLAEAHGMLGQISAFYDWNWAAAEQKFRLGLQLNPNSSIIHIQYVNFLLIRERYDEAIIHANQAHNIDPLSNLTNSMAGYVMYRAGIYDAAIEEVQKAVTIFPNYYFLHYVLGLSYFSKSQIEEAITALKKAVDLSNDIPWMVTTLATIYRSIDQPDNASILFNDLKERAKNKYVPPVCFVLLYKAFGDMDQAFKWLERACEERDSFLLWLLSSKNDNFRIPYDQRSIELLKKIGLEI